VISVVRCFRSSIVAAVVLDWSTCPPPAMPYCPIRGRRFSNFQEGAAASPINATESASWCRQLRKEPHGDRPGGFFLCLRPDRGWFMKRLTGLGLVHGLLQGGSPSGSGFRSMHQGLFHHPIPLKRPSKRLKLPNFRGFSADQIQCPPGYSPSHLFTRIGVSQTGSAPSASRPRSRARLFNWVIRNELREWRRPRGGRPSHA
jgi:hypothetical protein